jgi:hypothetical protein
MPVAQRRKETLLGLYTGGQRSLRRKSRNTELVLLRTSGRTRPSNTGLDWLSVPLRFILG